MGLDTLAFSGIVHVADEKRDEEGNVIARNCHWLWPEIADMCDAMASRQRHPGESPAAYTYNDSIRGPSCTYRGYLWWRDHLAAMVTRAGAATPAAGAQPFEDLVSFAQWRHGLLGTEASERLRRDFAAYAAAAETYAAAMGENGGTWLAWYHLWSQAFALASNGGALLFH
jgi:hypothetical protein